MENGALYKQILEISKDISLPVHKILDVLYILKNSEEIENNLLVTQTGISKNVLNQLKEQLSDLLESPSKMTKLNNNGHQAVKVLFPNTYQPTENLLHLEIDEKFTLFLKERLPANRDFDQFIATSDTVVRRVALLESLKDIRDKNILFLGDDDFTSVLVASTHLAKKITVVDIDTRITDKILQISQGNNLNIEVINHDIKKPLPEEIQNSYDVVFTDPPYTPEGIELFLARAVSTLDLKNQAARIYFCYGNSDRAKERFLSIHQIIIDSGLMIRYIFDKFNRYSNAESIGNTSTLFITEVTPKTHIIVKGSYDKPIYTNN